MRGVGAVSLLLVTMIAGCLTGDDTPVDVPDIEEAALPALAFSPPVNMIAGEGYGYEPSISVGPDGTLYMTAHKTSLTNEGTQLSSWFKYSRDNGTTWTDMPTPANVHEQLFAFEGDIAIDDTGRIYMLDTYAADNVFHVWETGDDGPEWVRTLPVQGTLGVDDRPWLDAHGDGVVYYLGNNGGPLPGPDNLLAGESPGIARIWFYKSVDAGLTWTPGYGFNGSGWCGLDANKADTDVVIVACNVTDTIWAYVSHDGGATFDRIEVATYGRGLSVPVTMWLDSDAAGNVYLFWIERESDSEPAELFLARSRDFGAGWEVLDLSALVPEEVRAEGLDKPWVSAGSLGVVAVTFYAALPETEDHPAGWFAKAVTTRDGLTAEPTWQIARTADAPAGPPGGGAPGDFFENALGPDDVLHVVFHGMPDGVSVLRPDASLIGADLLHVRQVGGVGFGAPMPVAHH